MKQRKHWPSGRRPLFVECGCCGHFHSRETPGSIDCRNDAFRFSAEELDAHYGENGWKCLTVEDLEHMEDEPQ